MAAVLVGVGERDLHVHRAARLEHDRGVQGELVERGRTDVRAGVQRQLGQRRARHDGAVEDDVIGQPRLRGHAQAAREERVLGVREAQRRRQQRVLGGRQARGAQVAGPAGRCVEPVALALEGVGRQAHALGGAEDAGPVHRGAVDMGVGEREREALEAAVVAAQRADRGGRGANLLDRVRDRPGQHRVRGGLDEQPRAVGEHALERRRELHRLAQVAVPVARVEGGGVDQPALERRVEGDLAADRRDRAEVGEQPVVRAVRRRRSARGSRPGSAGPRRPRRLSSASSASSAASSPATTVLRGPLTAAIERPLGEPRACSVSTSSAIDAIPPCPARPSAIATLRSATTRAASSSDSAPATQAAAISPCE